MLLVLWSQYTGHCQVFGIHMNYYMLQYTYAHFMHQLLLYLCSFKCTYYCSFMTNGYVSPWISALNALANLFDTFMSVACSWTCSHYTTLLNSLWYWHCKFSVYEPMIQWVCWTQHTYLINIRLDIIWMEMLKKNLQHMRRIEMSMATLEGS